MTASELYVFDTSALIAFSEDPKATRWMAGQLSESARHAYHLVSLCELARQSHPEAHHVEADDESRIVRAEKRAHRRRGLLTLLGEHRKTGRQLLERRRFLPLPIEREQLASAAGLSRELSSACYDRHGGFHAPCSLADHVIVSAGHYFAGKGHDVTIVTGDRHQLEVADHLGLRWVYAWGASRRPAAGPFPWGEATVRWIRPRGS